MIVMKTQILTRNELCIAIDHLNKGNPIAIPTETVYGLAAPVFDPAAIQRVFEIKGRPSDNPLIAHISNLIQAESIAESLPALFYQLAARFWPGPLSLIVKRKSSVPAAVSAGHPTIAIRIPSHRIALDLIEQFGAPLAAPSANLSGRPSATTVQDVLEDLDGKIGAVVDGGPCSVGIESTVLSLIHPAPTILRLGQISQEELQEALGIPVALAGSNEKILSPGMKYRHYAPKAKVRLIYDRLELPEDYVVPTVQSLYADLRAADRRQLPEIAIFCDEEIQSDPALMNRLLRASGQL